VAFRTEIAGTTFKGIRLLAKNDYYPFGLLHGGLAPQPKDGDNKYLYNGKELQTDLGLEWYDFGARMYDPQTGRWWTVDPKLEKYYPISSYAYCADNPLKFIDPNGKTIKPTNEDSDNAFNKLLASFAGKDNIVKLFNIVGGGDEPGLEHDNEYTTYNDKRSETQFLKDAKKLKVSKEKMPAALIIFKALKSSKVLELDMWKSAEQATTYDNGKQETIVKPELPGFSRLTANNDLADAIKKGFSEDAMTKIFSSQNNEYRKDYVGNGWVFYKNYGDNKKLIGSIVIDGSNKNDAQAAEILMNGIMKITNPKE
jgi:RHS repeat-associated protein